MIGISKIKNSKNEIEKIKNHSKPPKPVRQSVFKQFQQNWTSFWLFTENLTLLLPGNPNTNLPSNSNISKMLRLNFLHSNKYLVSLLMICMICILELIDSQKSRFTIFSVLKGLNKIKKKLKTIWNLKTSFEIIWNHLNPLVWVLVPTCLQTVISRKRWEQTLSSQQHF